MRKRLLFALGMLALAGCQSNPDAYEGSGTHVIGCNFGSQHVDHPLGSRADFEQNVGDRVLFSYDSSVLSKEAQQTLQRQAAWLAKHPHIHAVIEGHADERGTREYNLALGERRATVVKNYLMAHKVDASRLTVVSYGKERPYRLGDTEDIWSQNRRAVTVVHEEKEEKTP